MAKRWTEKEKALVKHMVMQQRKPCAEVAARLGRSPRAVYAVLYREEDATVASGRLPAGATGETAQPARNGGGRHLLDGFFGLFKRLRGTN